MKGYITNDFTGKSCKVMTIRCDACKNIFWVEMVGGEGSNLNDPSGCPFCLETFMQLTATTAEELQKLIDES
jgi:hypothetical protein